MGGEAADVHELHLHPVMLLHFPTQKNYQVALQHGNFPLKENTQERGFTASLMFPYPIIYTFVLLKFFFTFLLLKETINTDLILLLKNKMQ